MRSMAATRETNALGKEKIAPQTTLIFIYIGFRMLLWKTTVDWIEYGSIFFPIVVYVTLPSLFSLVGSLLLFLFSLESSKSIHLRCMIVAYTVRIHLIFGYWQSSQCDLHCVNVWKSMKTTTTMTMWMNESETVQTEMRRKYGAKTAHRNSTIENQLNLVATLAKYIHIEKVVV